MPSRILIIKTSSIGDILQAFYVLPYLKEKGLFIDWLVDQRHQKLVQSHPLIDNVVVSDINGWFSLKNFSFNSFRKAIREKKYDAIFDLQGNWKSSILLFFSRGKNKVGFGKKSVREKINLLFTSDTFNISKDQNVRTFYLSLFQRFYQDRLHFSIKNTPIYLKLTSQEKILLLEKKKLFSQIEEKKVFVSTGSFWENKKLSLDFIIAFLKKLEQKTPCHFFFSWGSDDEKKTATAITKQLKKSTILEKVDFSLWQHILQEMDLLLATDSCFLSLCQMTATPSFSFFGPTRNRAFCPLGEHASFQGTCPYSIHFKKQCPKLRTCKTGACIKNISVEKSFIEFSSWYDSNFSAKASFTHR